MQTITTILKNLRVPDLPYRLPMNEAKDAEQKQIVLNYLLDPLHRSGSLSVLKSYRDTYAEDALLPKWFNSLFLADRIIDVYLRKNDFSEGLSAKYSDWRFAIAYLFIYLGQGEEIPENFIHLLRTFDVVAKEYLGYTEDTPRGRFITEALERINLKLFVPQMAQKSFQETIFDEVVKENEKSAARKSKLLSRLLDTEKGAARSEFARTSCNKLILETVAGKKLPESAILFIDELWMPYIKYKILSDRLDAIPESIVDITGDIYRVFSTSLSISPDKKQTLAVNLVDSLEEIFQLPAAHLPASSDYLGALQRDVISVLQSKEIDLVIFDFKEEICTKGVSKEDTGDAGSFEGQWIHDNQTNIRHQLTLWEPLSNSYLLTNLFGAKTGSLRYDDLKQRLKSQEIKVVGSYFSIENVIAEIVKGLEKVVKAQLDQRRKAIEKAKKEAEFIKQEKIKAEKEAEEQKKKAKIEAVRVAKQAAVKKAEHEAEQLRLTLLKISQELSELKLGAWVEYEKKGVKQKGKLAVKTKASNKLIFVDSLGLNRFEIKIDEMAQLIFEKGARILDSGAEFDDSLQRTVSRIRMSGK